MTIMVFCHSYHLRFILNWAAGSCLAHVDSSIPNGFVSREVVDSSLRNAVYGV